MALDRDNLKEINFMLKITLNQMEKIEGGSYPPSCYAGIALNVVTTIGIGFFTFGTGAVLFALATQVGGWGITAAGCKGL
jgi:hypothetical protein